MYTIKILNLDGLYYSLQIVKWLAVKRIIIYSVDCDPLRVHSLKPYRYSYPYFHCGKLLHNCQGCSKNVVSDGSS